MSDDNLITLLGFGLLALAGGYAVSWIVSNKRASMGSESTDFPDELSVAASVLAMGISTLFEFELRANNDALPTETAETPWVIGFTWGIATSFAKDMNLSEKLTPKAKWDLMQAAYTQAFGLSPRFVRQTIFSVVKERSWDFIEGTEDGEQFYGVIQRGSSEDLISEAISIYTNKKRNKVLLSTYVRNQQNTD